MCADCHCPVYQGGDPLRYAADELQADRDFVLHCVRHNPANVQHASLALRADASVMLESLVVADGERTSLGTFKERSNGGTFEFADPSLKADPAFVIAALRLARPPPPAPAGASPSAAASQLTPQLTPAPGGSRGRGEPPAADWQSAPSWHHAAERIQRMQSLRSQGGMHYEFAVQSGRLQWLLEEAPGSVWIDASVLLSAIDVAMGTFVLLYPAEDIELFPRSGGLMSNVISMPTSASTDDAEHFHNTSSVVEGVVRLEAEATAEATANAAANATAEATAEGPLTDTSGAIKPQYADALLQRRGERRIMLPAVCHDGLALRFASAPLQDDAEVVTGARCRRRRRACMPPPHSQ